MDTLDSWQVVGRFGGDSLTWLLAYEIWVTLHISSLCGVPSLYKFLKAGARSQQAFASIKLPAYFFVMGIALPLGIAVCPFGISGFERDGRFELLCQQARCMSVPKSDEG